MIVKKCINMYHYFLIVAQSKRCMTFNLFVFLFLQNLKAILPVWPEDKAGSGRSGHCLDDFSGAKKALKYSESREH